MAKTIKDSDYLVISARVKALETGLLTAERMEQILEARSDDRPETVRARLKVYHELTDPVVDFYRGRGVLSEIDGTKSIENATAEILKILEG